MPIFSFFIGPCLCCHMIQFYFKGHNDSNIGKHNKLMCITIAFAERNQITKIVEGFQKNYTSAVMHPRQRAVQCNAVPCMSVSIEVCENSISSNVTSSWRLNTPKHCPI